MMNRRHLWLGLMTSGMLSVALFGCGDPEVSGGTTGVGGGDLTPEEVMMPEQGEDLSSQLTGLAFTQEDLRAFLSPEGVLELRPDNAFVATRIFMDTIAFPDVEIAYVPEGGVQTKFEPLEYTSQDETGELLAEIFFPGKVEAVYLRLNLREEFEGPQVEDAIKYLDTRFYAEADPQYALPIHLEEEHDSEESQGLELDENYITLAQRIGLPGDWNPSADVVRRGDEQYVAREGSPTRPSGGVRPGTAVLKRYISQRFPGVSTIGDYRVSRINNSNSYSVHSDGRALDIMIPMANPRTCSADNTVGDELAAWLLYNAEYIGVTFVIWERKSWGPYRPRGQKFRPYNRTGCTLQHADHVHVEISTAAANQQTPFFRDMNGGVTPPGGGEPPPISCSSATLGRRVDENSCVQQDSSNGCGWFKCTGYNSYSRLADSSSCADAQTTFGHQTCGATPQPNPEPMPEPSFDCPSATLGRRVDENTCVQQASSRGCGWFKCTSPGSYSRLSDASSCDEDIHANNTCAPTPTPGAGRTNQLVITMEWTERRVDLDINVEEPSGRLISYSRSARSPNDGNLALCDPTNPRRACASADVFKETIVWGEIADRVEPGTYTISVRNFDEPNSASYTVKAELYDADGNVTNIGNFSGTSTTYRGMSVGTVTVP